MNGSESSDAPSSSETSTISPSSIVSSPTATRSSRTSRPRTVLDATGLSNRARDGRSRKRLRAVDRRADRPGPCPQLGRHDLDRVERCRPDSPCHLGPDRVEKDVTGRCTPPPITMRSGVITVIMFAIPSPRYRPISASPPPAPASRQPEPARRPPRAVAVPQAAAIRSPRANASRQPRLPQPQISPSGSIVWWPISPAVPSWPWWTRPSTAMTPPTPVPSVSPTIDRAPRPAPSRSSARPNARASLTRAAGTPSASETGGATGTPGQPPGKFTRNRVVPATGVIEAGHADPDARDDRPSTDGLAGDLDEPGDDGRLAVTDRCGDLAAIERPDGAVAGSVHDRPLDVRPAEVEP